MSRFPIFNQVENTRLRSNIFDLTHDKKLSGKFGLLMPIQCIDLVPGDSFTLKSSAMVRLAPTIAPVMHRMNVYIHHFFVPNRILWENWENFITGGKDGMDNSVHPYVTIDLFNEAQGTLTDYFGLPIGADVHALAASREVNALPFAAYQAIFEEYYNDQNVGTTVDYELTDGDNTSLPGLLNIRKRSWQHDYLTSALPWTQRGPEAMLPLNGQADVLLDYPNLQATDRVVSVDPVTGNPMFAQGWDGQTTAELHDAASGFPMVIDPNGTLVTDLTTATGTTIIELRRAMKLQEWLEKNARGGSRYTEVIKVHFGVDSSDKRLQRPEYIGGSRTPIKVSEVLNTSATQGTPQGSMAGHGVSVGGGQRFSYRAEEHGYIISIMSVMPETAYQQGIPRHFLRNDKFDYYWAEFAHIGEQAVYNDEVFVKGVQDETAGLAPWGYTPRYSEYKFIPNTVHGDFRFSLDFWHMGRKFADLPPLDYPFMEMDYTEVDRIFAVRNGTDNLWCQVINEVKAKRLMPVFGTPKF